MGVQLWCHIVLVSKKAVAKNLRAAVIATRKNEIYERTTSSEHVAHVCVIGQFNLSKKLFQYANTHTHARIYRTLFTGGLCCLTTVHDRV